MNAVFQTEQNSPLLFAFQIKYNFGREVWERFALCNVDSTWNWEQNKEDLSWPILCTAQPIYWHQVVVKESTAFIGRVPSKKNGQFVLKGPNSPVAFRKGVLKATFGIGTAKDLTLFWFSAVQLLSCVRLFATPWTAACQASLPITNSWSLLKHMSIELVMPCNHLILFCSFLLLPSIFPTIRVLFQMSQFFTSGDQSVGVSASASSNEYSGLISFRMDWLDLLAV